MHKFKIGDRVRYTNPAGIYWGVFKIIGLDTRCGDPTYYLQDDGNPPHFSVSEKSLKLDD